MLGWVQASLFLLAAAGMLALVVQLVATLRHTRARARRTRAAPGISILKPLCGVDDGLAENLAAFAQLDYPDYELLLGVRDADDRAYPLACAAATRFPGRVRVVLQAGAPGLNPKVNQLISLAAAARHDLFVISDSNVRVEDDYLEEIAALFEAPRVGIVTHAIAGAGEQRMGSVLDNLHLAAYVSPGVLAAKAVAGRDIVIGKSMALRRGDLEALGGFAAVKDVLAEDYVLGLMVTQRLGLRVAVASRPIVNLSRDRSVRDFYDRYQRWSVIHRQAIPRLAYGAQALLNPLPIALGAVAVAPSLVAAALFGGLVALKIAIDNLCARRLRTRGFGLRVLIAVPLKDLVLAWVWARAYSLNHVVWRGNRLRVARGTRLVSV
jgi:ceramide glucosyltransferase